LQHSQHISPSTSRPSYRLAFFFHYRAPPPRPLHSFPTRRSSDLLRSAEAGVTVARTSYLPRTDVLWQSNRATDNNITWLTLPNSDRKSTRLNSSHVSISYAVFCLKKKKKNTICREPAEYVTRS